MRRMVKCLLVLSMLLTGCSKEIELVQQTDGMTQEAEEVTCSTEEMRIESYLEQMSIEEKIGQLFMIAVRKDEENQPITQIDEHVSKLLESYYVGGIILFSENIETTAQVTTFIKELQEESKIPLWIGVDEEGGIVSRVGKNTAINSQPFKAAYDLGQTKDTEIVFNEARRMGKLLKTLGFNLDFAPIGDIYNEPNNTVIGHRSFGTTQEEVIPMMLAFAKGLIAEGIQPVVKHFPGHGNTIEDSHHEIPYVHKTLDALEEEELVPFKTAIEENVGAIMKGHLIVSAVDEQTIVSLSSQWRDYMVSHYDLSQTLIITDALDMGAVVQNYGGAEAAVLSVLAGNDILLMPYDLEIAYQGVLTAYQDGRITEERIDESVRKILSKKVAQNILVLS